MNLTKKWLVLLTAVLFSMTSFAWADDGSMQQVLKENAELKKIVSDLSKKVDGLESRVARTENAPQSVAVGGSTAAPEEGHGTLLTKGGNIYMDGFVDTSFNWNFHTPGANVAAGNNSVGNSTLRAFDQPSDTFDLNNIQINMYRPAPEVGGVGFRTEFMYGSDAQNVESGGFLAGTDEFSIQEAYVDIKVPIGSGLTVWVGKFATLIGAEVIENHLNWNASRGFLFWLAEPATHTGARAMYSWLDGKVTTALGVVNGWDLAIDNNKIKDIEAQIKWIPTDNFNIAQNFIAGSPVFDDSSDTRWLSDTIATWVTPIEKLSVMASYDFGTQERLGKTLEGGPADWQGYALYAKYDLTEKVALGVRWEQFWDDQSVRSTVADELWEMTYTLDYKWYSNLLTRLEYRYDHAGTNNAGVEAFDSGTSTTQSTVGASVIYLFG